jgi:hypothetical protein
MKWIILFVIFSNILLAQEVTMQVTIKVGDVEILVKGQSYEEVVAMAKKISNNILKTDTIMTLRQEKEKLLAEKEIQEQVINKLQQECQEQKKATITCKQKVQETIKLLQQVDENLIHSESEEKLISPVGSPAMASLPNPFSGSQVAPNPAPHENWDEENQDLNASSSDSGWEEDMGWESVGWEGVKTATNN